MLEIDSSADQSKSFYIGEKDSPLYADVVVVPNETGGFTAQAYIEAPRRGDEILKLLTEKLRDLANRSGKPVIHIATPSNHGARKLYARTSGYVKTDLHDTHNNPVYMKTFIPHPYRPV